MDVSQLATTTVATLAPVLPYLLDKTKEVIAEEVINKVGEPLWNCAKAVWDRLWPKVQTKEAAREAAEDAAGNPGNQDALASLRRQITKLLSEDHALAEDLAGLLKQAGQTNVHVVASGDSAVAIGRDATGATIITGSNSTVGRK